MPLTVNEQRASFSLSGDDFSPPANDRVWKIAPESEKRAYWKRLGELAVERKRRELRKGLDAAGNKLKRVLKRSRPDGADGPPLSPHQAESRFQKYVAVRSTASGVTIFWMAGWAKVVGGHRSGNANGVVRDVVGLSPASQRWVKESARRWWRNRHDFHSPRSMGSGVNQALRIVPKRRIPAPLRRPAARPFPFAP
jgi:hypothetical protein